MNAKSTKELETLPEQLQRRNKKRLQAQKPSRESEARYHLLAENMLDVIYCTDMNGSPTYISPSVTRLLGYSVEQMMNRKLEDLLTPTSRDVIVEKLASAMAIALAGQVSHSNLRVPELELNAKDGRIVWAEVCASFLRDSRSQIAGIVYVIRDITERKRTEESLQESERRYRLLAENVSDVIWIADMNLCYKYISPSLISLLGYTVEEQIAQSVLQLMTPASAEVAQKTLLQELEADKAEPNPHRKKTLVVEQYRKDGSTVWVEIEAIFLRDQNGHPVEILGVSRDITERKRAAEKLEESNQVLRALIQASPLAIIGLDNDSNTRTWNPAAERIFSWSEEEVLGHPPPIVPEDNEEKFLALWNTAARQGKSFSDTEVRYRKKDGSLIDVSLSTAPLQDTEGNFSGSMAMLADITERKRVQKALRESEEQLRQSQKIEAVGLLAGGIAHDFNNVLTAIQGFTELALMKLHEDDPLYSDLSQVRKASLRAANLTRQLLLFSRRQPMTITPLDLNHIIEDLTKMLGRIIGEDISLITNLGAALWTIQGDAGTIEQVITNLAVNARDAMPEGGELTIRTENLRVDENYCLTHSEARPGMFACLSVKDTGTGMDPDIIARIFEPFFTTKGPGGGTGLGLSAVYGIVKQHEGWISVESSLEQGSLFEIYLPAVSLRPEGKGGEPSPAKAFTGKMERILLVEDDESAREFTRRGLSGSGYVVSAAGNAREARDIFTKEKGNFDLILCDVVLPDGRGPRLVDSLLITNPGISVVFTSGYTDEKSDWSAIQEGGHRFLQKPYSLSDMLSAVRDALEELNSSRASSAGTPSALKVLQP